MNKSLSNLLFNLTHDKSLHFDVGTSVYSSSSLFSQNQGVPASGNNDLDRSRVNVKLSYSFFNDKVAVSFGGDFDFGLNAAAQSGNFQWLPDLNVAYYITKDKKLRAIIFSKNSLDVNGSALGKQKRTGIGLSYSRDFEKIFGNKKEEIRIKTPSVSMPKTDGD